MSAAGEYGLFFCANCGATPSVDVTYAEKPTVRCPACGDDQWIFEPTEEVPQ